MISDFLTKKLNYYIIVPNLPFGNNPDWESSGRPQLSFSASLFHWPVWGLVSRTTGRRTCRSCIPYCRDPPIIPIAHSSEICVNCWPNSPRPSWCHRVAGQCRFVFHWGIWRSLPRFGGSTGWSHSDRLPYLERLGWHRRPWWRIPWFLSTKAFITSLDLTIRKNLSR